MKSYYPTYIAGSQIAFNTASTRYHAAIAGFLIVFCALFFGTAYMHNTNVGLSSSPQPNGNSYGQVEQNFLPAIFGKGSHATRKSKIIRDKSMDNAKFHAIFIACSDYTGSKWPSLETTISDADSLKNELINEYEFKPENIITLYNKNKEDILKGLDEKLASLNENDNVLIYYGGHGELDKQTNIAYWVPVKAEKIYEYISNNEITDVLSNTKAKHVLIMSDALFSGVMRGPAYEDDADSIGYKVTSRQLISSGEGETVPGVSVFIPTIVEELHLNKEHYFSISNLYINIAKTVRLQSGKTPILKAMEGIKGSISYGQFYFRRKMS